MLGTYGARVDLLCGDLLACARFAEQEDIDVALCNEVYQPRNLRHWSAFVVRATTTGGRRILNARADDHHRTADLDDVAGVEAHGLLRLKLASGEARAVRAPEILELEDLAAMDAYV